MEERQTATADVLEHSAAQESLSLLDPDCPAIVKRLVEQGYKYIVNDIR